MLERFNQTLKRTFLPPTASCAQFCPSIAGRTVASAKAAQMSYLSQKYR
jgi:hypothetical protein